MENQTGIEAEVEFSYEAVNSDELELRVGNIIKNIVMMDGGWWEGEINGVRGMFPDNFVKVLEKKKEEPRVAETSTKSKAPAPPVNGEVHHAKDSATSSSTGAVNLRENKPSRENRARVTYSYVPVNEDELKLLPNDVITDVVVVEDGWCEGNLNGRRGMFPSNFVSIITEEDEPLIPPKNDTGSGSTPAVNKIDPTGNSSSSNAASTPSTGQSKPVKLPGAIGFGVDIFKDAKPLRKRELGPVKSSEVKNGSSNLELMKKRNSLKKSSASSDDHPTVPVLKPEKIVEESPKPPIKTEPPKERAKVVYDYVPENSDELALKEGDIITILDKESVDSGWWFGECNGKQGVFPDNFVVLIPSEIERPKKDSAPLRPPAPHKPHNRPPSIEVKSTSIHKPLPPVKSPLDSAAPSMSPLKPPVKPDELSKSTPGPARPLKPTQRKPPPIKNKPAASKAVPVLPTTVKPEQEKKLVSMTHSSELPFDDIKSNNKLNHPNLSRPKTPNKRPPSVYGVKNLDGPKRSNTIARLSTITSNDEETSSPKLSSIPNVPPRPSKPFRRQATVPDDLTKIELTEELTSSLPSNKTTVTHTHLEKTNEEASPRDVRASREQDSTSNTSNEQELKNEIKSLKKEVKALKDAMASMRSDMRKEMKSLMEEVDEEKKLRMNMQVQFDRMKKLVYDNN